MKPKIKMQEGERFGSLVFTGKKQISGEGRSRRWLGEFLCDCGNTSFIRIDCVKCGNNRSCGCKSPNRNYKQKRQTLANDYPFYVLLTLFRKNSKKRNLSFDLTIEDLKSQYSRQNGKCFYTHKPLTLPENFLRIFDPTVASIDRIDSTIGYLPQNIQFTTKMINIMKQTLSHQEFIQLCGEVIAIHG